MAKYSIRTWNESAGYTIDSGHKNLAYQSNDEYQNFSDLRRALFTGKGYSFNVTVHIFRNDEIIADRNAVYDCKESFGRTFTLSQLTEAYREARI